MSRPRPLRVAFVGIRGIPVRYGGFETAVQEISTRFVERGHEAIVYCRREPGETEEADYRGVRKIYLPRLKLRVADTLSHTFLALLHLLFRRVDVLLLFNPANGPLAVIAKAARIPLAINVDGLEWRRRKWGRVGRAYLRLAARTSAAVADTVIADSRGIQTYYLERFGRRSRFIAYGAEIERSTDPARLGELGLAPRDYYLVVARLEPENNTDWIVREFGRLDTDRRLVVVGGVSYRSAYVEELERCGDPRVVFTGGIYDQEMLTELLANAFVYLHGHEVGGTNPVLLRALGCGAPVVYLDNAFNREVAGDAGIGVEQSEGALATALAALEAAPERTDPLRRRAPERIREAYTWDGVADGYEAVCLELSRRHRGTGDPED